MSKNTLLREIKAFLAKEGIEYCSALEFSSCRIINQRRMPDFDVKSAVVFLIPYKTGDYPNRNLSLYSVSRDYHLYANILAQKFQEAFAKSGEKFYLSADSSPLNERKAAIEAGLGVSGQNGLVINKKYGSYVFIGTILTSAVFDGDEYAALSENKGVCLSCGKCKRACEYLQGKTNICFSSLTQKKKTDDGELAAIRSRKIRWGCDICQEVCPMNKHAENTPIAFFYDKVLPCVSVEMIENMTDEEFEKRAYSWRGRAVILRNISEE